MDSRPQGEKRNSKEDSVGSGMGGSKRGSSCTAEAEAVSLVVEYSFDFLVSQPKEKKRIRSKYETE